MVSIHKIVASLGKKNSNNKNSILMANIVSIGLFMIVVPLLMLLSGYILIFTLGDIRFPRIPYVFNFALVFIGFVFRLWASYVHFRIGQGSPLYTHPTKKLIIVGPYKYTRNPIMLGMMIFYLGISLFYGSMMILITIFVLPSAFGNLYHKFIEEKELVMRFGTEYLDYKNKVPFLIPFLRWKPGEN